VLPRTVVVPATALSGRKLVFGGAPTPTLCEVLRTYPKYLRQTRHY